MSEKLLALAKEVRNAGFFSTDVEVMGGWERITLSSEMKEEQGFAGRSFWVACLSGNWFVGVWSGLTYHVADETSIVRTCIEGLTDGIDDNCADFVDEFKERHGLREASDNSFEALAGSTDPPE